MNEMVRRSEKEEEIFPKCGISPWLKTEVGIKRNLN